MRQNKFLFWSVRIAVIIWIVCIIAVALLVGFSTKWFTGTVDDTPLGKSALFLPLFLSCIGVGVLSFGIAVLLIAIQYISNKKLLKFQKSFKGFIGSVVKILLLFAFFPLVLLYSVSGIKNIFVKTKKRKGRELKAKQKKRNIFIRIIGMIVISITLVPVWIGGYWLVGAIAAQQFGYVPTEMDIVGTGSMYPTWPKGTKGKSHKELAKEIISKAGFLPYPNGIVIGGKRFFGHTLERGDIITWRNDATRALTSKDGAEPAGLLKRLIGLPGDTIELKNGIVYLNGEPQKEPYTAKPHSTFGEAFLNECQVITVPPDAIFAMGDNRKGSADSREIGFAPIKDIDFVLPLSKQKGKLDKNWRDTSKDLEESSKIRLDKEKYLALLNEKRKEAGVQLLTYQPKLEKSSVKRGEIILKYNDFSFEATKSGYTMVRAMADSGYGNIVYGETSNQGYYEADELMDNQFEFPDTKNFLLKAEYQEIGIAEVEGSMNGCPTQVVIQHLAGYVPPNYTKEVVDSWKTSLANLREIQPSWERLRTYQGFYDKNKSDVDRITGIISTRIGNISLIVLRMEANQWLSAAEEAMIDQDKVLYDEQEILAKRLNSQ